MRFVAFLVILLFAGIGAGISGWSNDAWHNVVGGAIVGGCVFLAYILGQESRR